MGDTTDASMAFHTCRWIAIEHSFRRSGSWLGRVRRRGEDDTSDSIEWLIMILVCFSVSGVRFDIRDLMAREAVNGCAPRMLWRCLL